MDPSSLNILVEAKKEYLGQLYLVMCPNMIEAFEDLYKEAYKASKGRKVLIQYQMFLKEVVNWNDHMIKQHTDNMCKSCSWFSDLLAAVFVSSVKILSSVRLNSENNKISLKLPTNQVFIHGCFINIAKDLYKNPYIYHEDTVEHERDLELIDRFSRTIETTVKEMIPVQEILKSCISQKQGESIDFTNKLPEDGEDPDLMEDEEEDEEEEGEGEGNEIISDPQQEGIPQPVEGNTPVEPQPEAEGEAEAEAEAEVEAQPQVNETRQFDIIKKPSAREPPKVQSQNLFDDAPDH